MTTREKGSSGGKRGRPREIDKQAVALVALRLFEARGYAQVTMKEIAQEASVSRRTLFRLFPSKADMVWDGIWEVLELARAQAEALCTEERSLPAFVDALFMPGLKMLEEPALTEVARRRLRLVAASPELFDHPALHELRGIFATTIRSCVKPQKAPPELLANALVSVVFAAVLWWASDDSGMSAVDAWQATFAAFADLHESFAD